MKKCLYLIVTVVCVLLNATTTAQILILDSCHSIAQKNYPLIKQYELIEQAKEYSISNANKAYLPQLNVTGIGGYIFGGFPNLGPATAESNNENVKFIGLGQASQLIWDGGATKTQKEIIRAQSDVERAGIDVQMYALKDRINQLYFGILLIDEQIKQVDIQINTLERNAERVKLMNENGLALNSDMDELRAEVLKARQRETEFQYSRKSFLYMLSLFMGIQLDDSVKMQHPDLPLSENITITRPELFLYESQRKLIQVQSSIDKVKLMPKIGILGTGVLIAPGVNLGGKEKSSLALAGLSVSWELGGLYTHSGSKKLNQVNILKIQNQQESFLFNTTIQSRQSNVEIEKYKAIIKSDEEIVKLRSNIRASYQLQYNNGTCSLFDLISATEKETEARSNQSLHNVQLMHAIYQLKTTNGN